MKLKDRFRVTEFTNPNSVAFRVYGRKSDGTVVRENYKEYPVALARKQELEIEAINSPVVLVMQPTRLTTGQLRDAEAAYQRLTNRPDSAKFTLVDCVEHFFRNGRVEQVEKTVADAFKLFLAEKKVQNVRNRTYLNLKSRVGNLSKKHGPKRVGEITTKDVKELLRQVEKSPVTFNSHRSVLHGFFGWCLQQDYCSANPVSRITPARIDRQEPTVLALDQVLDLLRAARNLKEGVLIPYFALGLFCGLRPTEIQRLSWDSIDLEAKLVTIRGEAAKLRARRVIELSDNTVEWLEPHSKKTPIVGPNWRRDFDAVRRACGFRGSVYRKKCDADLADWPQDVLRHTAISFWQAQFKDEGECADRHGNSVETVHRYYRGLVRPQDVQQFWQLTPASLDGPHIIPMPKPAAAA